MQGEVQVVQGGGLTNITYPHCLTPWELLEGGDHVGTSLPPLDQSFLTHLRHGIHF